MQPSAQYFIGNTPGNASEDVIKKVLEKCSESLIDNNDPLIIESVHCLTKDPEPRTRCWRVVVPHRFKGIMENDALYPEGWRYREFIGIFRNSSRGTKKQRTDGGNIVDQVMSEAGQISNIENSSKQINDIQLQLLQLLQSQVTTQVDAVKSQSEDASRNVSQSVSQSQNDGSS